MQDNPKKTKQAWPAVHRSQQGATQSNKQVETIQITKQLPSKLITSKNQIMAQYTDVFEGIVEFPEPHTSHI